MTQQENNDPEIVPSTTDGCHTNIRNLANLWAITETTKKKVLIIAHLGTGEPVALNRGRLNQIKVTAEFSRD
ncbi:MAG TPA: hypothetical protein VFC63_17150 [Blastocatellia bacterium]|nr:hypothetical protein [Blastocatellia bacterium]